MSLLIEGLFLRPWLVVWLASLTSFSVSMIVYLVMDQALQLFYHVTLSLSALAMKLVYSAPLWQLASLWE